MSVGWGFVIAWSEILTTTAQVYACALHSTECMADVVKRCFPVSAEQAAVDPVSGLQLGVNTATCWCMHLVVTGTCSNEQGAAPATPVSKHQVPSLVGTLSSVRQEMGHICKSPPLSQGPQGQCIFKGTSRVLLVVFRGQDSLE